MTTEAIIITKPEWATDMNIAEPLFAGDDGEPEFTRELSACARGSWVDDAFAASGSDPAITFQLSQLGQQEPVVHASLMPAPWLMINSPDGAREIGRALLAMADEWEQVVGGTE